MPKTTCYNCFREIKEESGTCPYCGYLNRANKEDYPVALPEGTVLNGCYIVGRVLGQGGFGITYVAQDYKTKQLVAIKEYFPDTMAIRTNSYTVSAYNGQKAEHFQYGKECFLSEAKTLAEFIGNASIVRVHCYFEENGTAYFVMDYVEGESFQKYLHRQGRKLFCREVKNILFPVMDALTQVHAKGIIHRDISPDNIFITKDGNVKLLDFGSARYSLGNESHSLDVVLKHGFSPKEQYTRHGKQGSYTDVYSMGATMYYALTLRLPPDSIDRSDKDDLILPSSIGSVLNREEEKVLLKALAVQPSDRYQSMDEFKRALIAADRDNTTDEKEVVIRKISPTGKGKWIAVAAAVIIVVVALGFGGSKVIGDISKKTGSNELNKTAVDSGAENLSSEGMVKASIEGKAIFYDRDGNIDSWYECEYDKKWNRIKDTWFDSDDHVTDQTEYEFDSYGHMSKATWFNSNGSVESWIEYTTDSDGHPIKSTYFCKDGSMDGWCEYDYDNAGYMIKQTEINVDGSVDYWIEYTNNSKGEIVMEDRYGSSGNLEYSYMYQYRYDENGNLIKTQVYDNGKLVREISYRILKNKS